MIVDTYQRHRWTIDFALALVTGAVMGLSALYVGSEGLGARLSQVLIGAIGIAVVMLIVRDIKRLLLLVIFVDMSTALDFHLTCNSTSFLSSCGINISLTLLSLVILYTLWFLDSRRSNDVSEVRGARFGLIGRLGAAFIMAGVLSLVASRNVTLSIYQLWLNLSLFALFFYLSNNIRTRSEILYVILAVFIGLAIQVTIMELRSFGILQQDARALLVGRVVGTLQSPNAAGGYLSQTIVFLSACFAVALPGRLKWGMIVVLLVALGNLVGSESRGAWFSLVIGVTTVGIFSLRRGWLSFQTLLVGLLVVVVLASFFSAPIIDRLTRDDKGSAEARGPLAEIAFNIIRANPVIGVGLNNFGIVLFDYVEADQFGAWLNLVHNRWLLIWAETGTIGMIFYVSFYFTTIWQAWKLVRRGHPVYGPIALGIMASMLGAGTHMLMEIYKWRILQQMIWTDAALIVALARLQAAEDLPVVGPVVSSARASAAHFSPKGKFS